MDSCLFMHAFLWGIYLEARSLLENLLLGRKCMKKFPCPPSGIKVKLTRNWSYLWSWFLFHFYSHWGTVACFFDVQRSSTMQYTEAYCWIFIIMFVMQMRHTSNVGWLAFLSKMTVPLFCRFFCSLVLSVEYISRFQIWSA